MTITWNCTTCARISANSTIWPPVNPRKRRNCAHVCMPGGRKSGRRCLRRIRITIPTNRNSRRRLAKQKKQRNERPALSSSTAFSMFIKRQKAKLIDLGKHADKTVYIVRAKSTMSKKITVSDGKLMLVLEPAEEGGYIVTSPLDPELITEAESVEEAFVMARDAMRGLAKMRAADRRKHRLAMSAEER